ncbi:MAG: NTP transferase domain-containing protein [Patescibacteria group bacterium]
MTQIIVLAAGKGIRMNNHGQPKVLTELNGKAIIQYLIDSINQAKICKKPLIVVGYKANLVKQCLGKKYDYILQKEQLGTGHAVACAKNHFLGKVDNILVLYGDHPFISSSTIKNLDLLHQKEKRVLTMMTTIVKDFNSWRAPLYDFGRVLRNDANEIIGIIEKKDATPLQLEIKEVSPSYFCFKSDWLWKNIDKITNRNKQKEYYLPDLVKIAISQGHQIASIIGNPLECLGINTKEQLELISKLNK